MKREDMTASAKFRAICARCDKGQPRATTAHTAAIWMNRHEAQHRQEDAK